MDLFGSAVGSTIDIEHSDIDVLVEFADLSNVDRFDSYFGLKEDLEQLFGRPVDLVSSAGLRNPYFRQQVLQTREELYAA
jgi:predicted nucleotidyltransferase